MHRLSFLPAALLLLISFFIDLYVFGGLRILFPSEETTSYLIFAVAFWTISLALEISFIYGFYMLHKTGRQLKGSVLVMNSFFAVLASKLIFLVFLLIQDAARILLSLFGDLPARSYTFTSAGLVLSLLILTAFVFGVTRGKYHFKVKKSKVLIPNLPESFEGFTITHISDIHSGSFDSAEGVQRGIDLINAQGSDLFVFTGDLVNNLATEIEPWIPFFSQIQAPFGKYSVLGNHDYGDYVGWATAADKAANLRRLMLNHEKIGFRLLLDENVQLRRGDDVLHVIGVENWGIGFGQRGNLNKAVVGIPPEDTKILLSHDPSHWSAEVRKHPSDINLTLSGHTHGMQFGFELFGIKWSPVKYRYQNWAGLYDHFGKYLYVNRGFGFIGLAGRVGIWPEITVLQLQRA